MGMILPVLQIGLAAVTGFAQMSMANQQYNLQSQAITAQTQAVYKETQRQEEDVNRTATEQTSDRMLAANNELATIRVAALERGVSGTTLVGFARTVGYLEGVDVARIDKNRASNIAAGEQAKANAKAGYMTNIAIAQNQRQTALIGATLGIVGSGLQIGAGYYKDQQTLHALQNTRTV